MCNDYSMAKETKQLKLYLPINDINDFIDMIGKKKSVYIIYNNTPKRFPADIIAHWQLTQVLNLIKDNRLCLKYECTNRQNS